MKVQELGSGHLDRVLPLAIAGLFVATVLLLLSHSAGAQVFNVQISELACNTDPEVVVIVNDGLFDVDFTGWKLQSDPTSDESFDLTGVGILSPQESVLVQSGPSATGAFVWSRDFVFRDEDVTDFAQIVASNGVLVVKVNCGPIQRPTAAATPAQTPAPEPSPTPTVLSVNGVPFGGGPPSTSAGLIPPAAMIVAGSWLLMAGLGTVAVPLLHRKEARFLVPP